MSDLAVRLQDFRHDFAEQLAWANQARIDNVHSVAQLDQCSRAVAELTKVLEGSTKWDFMREEAMAALAKLNIVASSLTKMRGQANACMAYLDQIETKSANPQTVEEVDMLQSFFVQTVQETKQEYDACMKAGEDVKATCEETGADIKGFTKDVVVRAVTLNHDETIAILEWATAGAQVVLSIAEVANPEPLSSTASWGIKVLINGVGTLAREITVAVRQHERTLEDALKELEPLDIAKSKVKDAKLAIGWALEPLSLIKGIGPIIKTAIMTGVGVVLDAQIMAAQAEIDEAKKKALGKQEEEAQAKEILRGFGEALKDELSGAVQEAVGDVAKQVKELVDEGKKPEDFINTIVGYVFGSLLKPVVAKIVDPAQAVTASDISSFAQDLTKSFSDTFAQEYLTEADKEKLEKIGPGTQIPVFDQLGVKNKNQEFLKGMEKGEDRSVYVGASPVLEAEVALLVNGAGHREEDLHYVLSLAGNAQGTVTMVDKGGALSTGELRFEGVPEDLVKKYFKNTKLTNKKLSF